MNWESSLFWGITSIIATIFCGFLFGYIFYIKSDSRKILSCSYKSNILISKKMTKNKGLKISYNKNKVKELMFSSVIIHNIGKAVIEGNDIAQSSPITIHTTKEFYLNDENDCEIDKTYENSLVFLKKIDKDIIELSFDFIKPQNKIILSLLHCGELNVTGDLKTGVLITKDDSDSQKRRARIRL